MNKPNKLTIALDGPSGAGKSTIAKAVAEKLGLLYLDTGAMYRTCGLACSRAGLTMKDQEEIIALVGRIEIDIRFVEGEQHIYLDGEDVSEAIRSPEISIWASDVSAIPEVRVRMTEMQREIASRQPLIMDGRDIGTYVLPDADVKIFLTAKPEVRAERRFEQLEAKHPGEVTYAEVLRDIMYRDKQDSGREFAPLKQAEDAIVLDTSDQTVEETVAQVLAIVRRKQG